VSLPGAEGLAVTPKSFTEADPEAVCGVKAAPVKVNVPMLPTSGGVGGITPVDGGTVAFTITVTCVLEAVVEVVVDPLVVVVVLEVLIVPRLHSTLVLPLATVHVPPVFGVAEAMVEFVP
jgi:hypothetical protein